jgi:hypothetical protein
LAKLAIFIKIAEKEDVSEYCENILNDQIKNECVNKLLPRLSDRPKKVP